MAMEAEVELEVPGRPWGTAGGRVNSKGEPSMKALDLYTRKRSIHMRTGNTINLVGEAAGGVGGACNRLAY